MTDTTEPDGLSFEEFRQSFYYGEHSDMQFKYLARMSDTAAADTIATVLAAVGETLDTGDLEALREVVHQAQVAGYLPAEPVAPAVEVPFTPLAGQLPDLTLALLSAGGVFRLDDDPMGPDGPTQEESLGLLKEFLRADPTLSIIPVDTSKDQLTARHPGYDARSAQRDPSTVFPLEHLRDLAAEGRLQLADEHYGFTGATSQRRLEKQVAPRWAEHMAQRDVDVVFLVAT